MSLNDQQQTAFREHLDVPFDVWDELLVDVFESVEFKEWLKDDHSWQLRIIGPPGCGKTTVSALTERRLRSWYAGQNVKIACIYFRRDVRQAGPEFVVTMLRSILSQFVSLFEIGNKVSDLQQDQSFIDDMSLENLRDAVKQRISQMEHAFLLVDDIDLCHDPVLGLIEAELAALQSFKLSIMITSRVPHIYNIDVPICDIHNGDDINLVYWYCRNCESNCDQELDESPNVVCQACKDTKPVCSACGLGGNFYEPYSCVLYKLNYLENLAQFVARELEAVHGDLGLRSQVEDMPPLSTLGRSLERARPLLAERLRDNIADRSDYNIALARARLDLYFDARSVEDVERVGDRLPEPLLHLFEAAIRHINDECFPDRELGLNALLAVSIHFNNRPFSELQDWLQSIGLLELEAEGEEARNLLRTLRATRGLLNVDYGDAQLVQPYSYFLTTYVAENYSEVLFSLRPRIDELKSSKQQDLQQDGHAQLSIEIDAQE